MANVIKKFYEDNPGKKSLLVVKRTENSIFGDRGIFRKWFKTEQELKIFDLIDRDIGIDTREDV